MPKKLVIMASEKGREALRTCGVLPPSVFKDFAEIDEHDYGRSLSPPPDDVAGAGAACNITAKEEKRLVEYTASLGFYVWPHDPDYKRAAPGFGDYPLLSMLGMAPPKNNAEYLERKIVYTKLLGSTILHVVLLDEFDLASKTKRPSPCSISSVLEWCDTFQAEILREFSEEQTTGIEHVFILVARNPNGLEVKQEEVESFCRRLNVAEGERPKDVARIRTCFFIDRNLEVELGNPFFPSGLVWAQMVGRLLLRILIGLEYCPNDPIGWCDGGIRLWKASEFVLDFQPERVHQLMSEGVGNFIEQLRASNFASDTELSLMPWTPSVDCVLKTSPGWKCRDVSQAWNKFSAKECERETFDEGRWRELLCPAKSGEGKASSEPESHDGDVDNERTRLTNEIHSSMTSTDAVRDVVSSWVSKVSKEIRAYFTKDAGAGVSEYWNKVVQLCFRRAQCKDVLENAADEYESAKSHYVQKKYCLGAVVALSLCAGLVYSRLVSGLGAGQFMALLLWAGTFVGGLTAIGRMLYQHDKYGGLGRKEFLRLCETADGCIVARDKCAHDQIKKAIEVRARMLQLAKMRHFNQLVSRLQKMIDTELVAPSAEVFVEDDLPGRTEDDHVGQDLKDQCDRFFRETHFRIGVEAKDELPQIGMSFPKECESVKTSWSALCATCDPRSTANFPARYFVPFLRQTLKNFRNKYRPEVWRALTEDSITELIAKFRQPVVGQKGLHEIARRIRNFMVDDAYYSAHIDFGHKHDIEQCTEFFYAPIFDNSNWSDAKSAWEGKIVNAQPSRLLLGRTPHFAMLFTQSRVDFTVKEKRLALRVAGEQTEDDDV